MHNLNASKISLLKSSNLEHLRSQNMKEKMKKKKFEHDQVYEFYIINNIQWILSIILSSI